MDLQLLIAQWSGRLPPGFLRPPSLAGTAPTCAMKRCRRPCAIKKDGEYAKCCQPCLDRRAASCRRRRAHFVARGGCRRCAYRKRAEADFLCERCREDRTREREQARRDARAAAAIDEFATSGDGHHRTSALQCGVSPWNARPTLEPSAAYWSPLPDPEPREQREWAKPLFDDGWRYIDAASAVFAFEARRLSGRRVCPGGAHSFRRYSPIYLATIRSRPCPSSREIFSRARLSVSLSAPSSSLRDGPPATGAFHPVSSS